MNPDDRVLTNEERRNADLPTAYAIQVHWTPAQIARAAKTCAPVTVGQLRYYGADGPTSIYDAYD